ncbi:hypothetical protein [Arthrobacter humicola]|nr:hypothetical protein [Arthrobacter humicola]
MGSEMCIRDRQALASATIAAFGLGAIQGIVTPVFFAFVLTLCVLSLIHI